MTIKTTSLQFRRRFHPEQADFVFTNLAPGRGAGPSRCDDCGRTRIDGGGVAHAVDDAVAEMVGCDNQRMEPSPGPHVGAVGAASRATQTIPPAARRHVVRRDQRRCVVPGCRNHRFLDVHHIDPRSEDGGHDPERLAMLCGAHHRAVHAGHLCIHGTASGGFSFRHADGSPYGANLRPPAIDVAAHVFGALHNLGFSQTSARQLVDAVLRAGRRTIPRHSCVRRSARPRDPRLFPVLASCDVVSSEFPFSVAEGDHVPRSGSTSPVSSASWARHGAGGLRGLRHLSLRFRTRRTTKSTLRLRGATRD